MYAENEPAMKRNDAVLNDLPGELYIIEAYQNIPDNCRYIVTSIHFPPLKFPPSFHPFPPPRF